MALRKRLSQFTPVEVDWKAKREEQQLRYDKDLAEYNIRWEAEQERISAMACPVCKGTNKENIIQSQHNGIYGPGSHTTVQANFWLCRECGVHYSDLNKTDLNRPNRDVYFY